MSKSSRILREKRSELVRLNGETLEKIKVSTDPGIITSLEGAWDTRDDEIVKLTKAIEREEGQAFNERGLDQPIFERRSGRDLGADPLAASAPVFFRDVGTGRAVAAVRGNQSIAEVHTQIARPKGRVGDLIASVFRGRPVSEELREEIENRTMSIGSSAGGGYAVPAPYSVQFIDLARANMVCVKAGALTLPMEGNTLQLARIEGDPTASFKAENIAFSASDVTLGRMLLTAQTVGCFVKMSEELMQDSPNIGQILEEALLGAMGVKMDAVALVGSGSGEPGGIMKSGITANTNVQTLVVGGTPNSYGFFSRMVDKVRTANHEPTAAIWNPRDLGTLDRLTDTTGQPLLPPRSFTQLPHFSTTSIPANLEVTGSPNDASIAIVGKFPELVIAPRMEVAIMMSRESNDGTDSAFTKYQIHIRAIARMDVGIMRGAAFCVGTGIDN